LTGKGRGVNVDSGWLRGAASTFSPRGVPKTSGVGRFSRLLPTLTANIAVNVGTASEISTAHDVVGNATPLPPQ
jgi:hypothetical protein